MGVKCDWPSHHHLADRALAIFGRALYENLFPIQFTCLENISIEGLFCSPEYSGSSAGRLYTFVNHRIVKDKTIQSAIAQAYKEFLHGKQPCVVLFVTIPLDLVDVNVHPTKHEIRFQQPDHVFRAVYRAIRSSLEKTPWIRSENAHSTAPSPRYFEMLPDSAFRTPEDNMRRSMGLAPEYPGRPPFVENSDSREIRQLTPQPGQKFFEDASIHVFDGPSLSEIEKNTKTGNSSPDFETITQNPNAPSSDQIPPILSHLETQQSLPLEKTEECGYFSRLKYIGQHALTYLICADGDSLVIIDQHAAHERINFENLKRVADDLLPPASQGLLFPLLLKLDTRLTDILHEFLDFFEKLGFQIDELGGNAFALRAIPECLQGYDYEAMIRDALTDLGDCGRTTQFEDFRDNILATMACHSSIRAGHKMTPDEVRELFRLMDATGFRSNCPHGRPVHFVLSIAEIEKRFLRTGYTGLH